MSDKNTKAQGDSTQANDKPFADCMEQMMSACGPEMKKWMEACASNMSKACPSCCGTQTKTETTEKE
ncbi:hypothetical protein ACFLXL_00600 [Chloroflexota bacterium]